MGRPLKTFNDFIGQRAVVDLLQQMINGAKTRGEPFPHALFSGPSGVGKTLLAQAVAHAYGTTTHLVSGRDSALQLMAKIMVAKFGDVVFIDEAHNLAVAAQEALYEIIDRQKIPGWAMQGSGPNAAPSTEEIPIEKITLIIATDQPGKLLNALKKRLSLAVPLGYYSRREMQGIIDRVATNIHVLLSPQARNRLARVAWGLPRRAKQLVENLRLYFPQAETAKLGVSEISQFLRTSGIDRRGLDRIHRKYMKYLARNGKASQESLALFLGSDRDSLRQDVEALLQRMGMITIGSGGRMLTQTGHNHLAAFKKAKMNFTQETENGNP